MPKPKKGRPKKDSAIVLRDLETRIVIPHDEPIIIKPTEDQVQNKKYYEDRIKELLEANRKLKDALNSLADKRDELKYLREFRSLFMGHCVKDNVRKTIIMCTNTIKREDCGYKEMCIERKKWMKLIEF
jgi:hypothetical protein